SKHLANQRGLEDIQADVDIHGGNSGCPLLDKNGNVVSISYAGLGDSSSEYSVGLNFFIPIMDALNQLKMKAVDKNPGSQGRKHYSAAGLISGLFNVKVRSTEV
ncbi:MAG: hypothetical protein QMB02_08525, partial [Rhodospirillales bacterium]